MADPENICEVRTEGGVYRKWLTVQVGQSYNDGPTRPFALTCAEPSAEGIARLVTGSRIGISLAGEVVIDNGYIGDTQRAMDANRHAVQISGFSKAELTLHGSANPGQFRGYTVNAIANAALKPLGLKFRLEGASEAAKQPFPNARVHHGETIYAFIVRLCRQRGLFVRTDPNGDLVAGAKEGGGGNLFVEGKNILAIRVSRRWEGVGTVVANSQQPGSDSLFGKKAAEVGATTEVPGGQPGVKRLVVPEMPLSQKELQTRTDMEVQALLASFLQVQLSYKGWLNPSGKLWDLTDYATVRAPTVLPELEGGELKLQLFGYAYSQNPEGQTTTTIDLVNPAAFRLKYADGQANSGLYDVPKPSTPETPT